MVSLNTLRSAAQPILSLAREEIEFSVEDVTVSHQRQQCCFDMWELVAFVSA